MECGVECVGGMCGEVWGGVCGWCVWVECEGGVCGLSVGGVCVCGVCGWCVVDVGVVCGWSVKCEDG